MDKISDEDLRILVGECGSYSEIYKTLGYKRESKYIRKRINKLNLNTDHFNRTILDKCSDKNFKEIIEESNFFHEVNSKLGYSKNVCPSIEKRIKKRIYNLDLSLDHFGARKDYSLNRNAFEIMNNDYAWILGLIYSDGHLNNGNGVYITSTDLEMLEKAEKILEGRNLIVKRKPPKEGHKQAWYLYFMSKNIVKILKSYGLHYNKDLNIKWPELLKKCYFWSFIRGVFDGDGSYYIGKTYGEYSIHSGSKIFIYQLNEKLTMLNINGISIRKKLEYTGRYTYSIRINRFEEISYIYAKMYYKTTAYLPRKKEKFEEYFRKRDKIIPKWLFS